MKEKSVLVAFDNIDLKKFSQYEEIIAGDKLKSYLDPGSIYEATELLEELPKLNLLDGTSITQALMYKDFELWWIHNNNIFRYFCLPFTQNRRLLEYLKSFESVNLVNPHHENLFRAYLEAYGVKVNVLKDKKHFHISLGILLQIFITTVSLPILIVRRFPILVYTGDKFEKDKDYDFRMKFIYEELRKRKLLFLEFIRGIESWKIVVNHAWKRFRPAVYSEGVVSLARLLGSIGGRRTYLASVNTPEYRFKLAIATQYIQTNEDVWAVRIMKTILSLIGTKAAFIPAASERSWHTLIACKLNNILTVGIMHGVQSRYYNTYDFLTGFDGNKHLGVDKMGVWSEWWKNYYLENSDLYSLENIFVSGPMRPLVKESNINNPQDFSGDSIKVLFVSEEMAVPEEVLPYLYELIKHKDIKVILKFRPYRDGFENWLKENKPEVLTLPGLTISREGMQEAIKNADITVGCQSTGVLEALLQFKTLIYFKTNKWGDYYNLKNYDKKHTFFVDSPEELVELIKKAKPIPLDILKDLQERFFGDPYKNGSKWVVDEIEKVLDK